MLGGIRLEAGAEVTGLRLILAPGGRLRIRYEGPSTYAQLRVHQDGVVVAADGIHTGTEVLFPAPAGELTIVISIGGELTEERSVDLLVGEDLTVLFDL